MKTLLLSLLISICSANLFASGGEITGQVKDKGTNEAVVNANVQLISNGKVVKATITDIDGYYTIKELASGTYNLRVSMVGFDTILQQGIKVYTDQMTTTNFALSGTVLESVTITETVEKIDLGFGSGTEKLDAKDLERIPLGVLDMGAVFAGAYQEDIGKPVTFRGSRVGTTLYMVDGMRIIGEPNLPMTSIEEEMVFEGGIPAKYGDTVGGVIVINTKSFHFY